MAARSLISFSLCHLQFPKQDHYNVGKSHMLLLLLLLLLLFLVTAIAAFFQFHANGDVGDDESIEIDF
jgi:hypothetical protein